MDLQAVRTGIAERLETIDGIRVFDFMPENVSPPAAVVGWPESIEFDMAFARGLDGMPTIPVYVFVGRADERSAQRALAEFAAGSGTSSVKEAIENDKTLGGVAHNAQVTRVRGFANYPVGAIEMLGCIFEVRIHGGNS